jgi:DNA-binding GntR family transcriptional regulator
MKLAALQNPAGKANVIRGVIHGLLHERWRGGDRLTEVEAAGLFKVSRTPVREALVELAALGIVELRRNCGAVFRPFGEKEVRDLYAVRSLLEVEAARLAASRISDVRVAGLTKAFEELRAGAMPDKGWQLDRALHAEIASSSENPRLEGEIARYGDLIQTIREAVGGVLAGIQSTSLDEHLRILRQLKRRKADAAAEAMREHLEQASDSAVKALLNLRRRGRRG